MSSSAPLQSALEFVVIGDDVDAARAVAAEVGGQLYVDDRMDTDGLPFRTLVRAVTDRPGLLDAAASVGRYVVCARPQKLRNGPPPSTAVIHLNAMVTNPAMTPLEADTYWRDRHAPLALQRHVGMTQYVQLSVVHRIAGPDYQGFALCEFDSMEDLRERFFDSDEGRRAILADVATFADTANSPRRLLAHR